MISYLKPLNCSGDTPELVVFTHYGILTRLKGCRLLRTLGLKYIRHNPLHYMPMQIESDRLVGFTVQDYKITSVTQIVRPIVKP